MTTTFKVGIDARANPTFKIEKSDVLRECNMLANVVTTCVVPDDAVTMLIAAEDTLFWGRETFSIVTSNTFTPGVAEMNGALRNVTSGETLYFRSPRAQLVSLSFFNQSQPI